MTAATASGADEERFAGAGGTEIRSLRWGPRAPRAALVLSHGLGEHAGRYADTAAGLASLGIATFGMDHRGHGVSEGRRGDVGSFDLFVGDLERFRIRTVERLPAGTPLFLIGHSMGGLIALRHLQQHPGVFRGAVLSAPAIGFAVSTPEWVKAGGRVLERLLPWLPLPTRVEPEDLSRDLGMIAAIRADPLVHATVTPRLFVGMERAARALLAHPRELELPLLFLIPTGDRIVSHTASLAFARAMQGDVTVRTLDGLRHEPLNEIGREALVDEIGAWILARVGA